MRSQRRALAGSAFTGQLALRTADFVLREVIGDDQAALFTACCTEFLACPSRTSLYFIFIKRERESASVYSHPKERGDPIVQQG
jgi:hypothetical protein